jgi:hypothetical protein
MQYKSMEGRKLSEFEKEWLINAVECSDLNVEAIMELLEDPKIFYTVSRFAKYPNLHSNEDYIIDVLRCQRCGDICNENMRIVYECGCRICGSCNERHQHHGCYSNHIKVAQYDSDDDVCTHENCRPCCPNHNTKVTLSYNRQDREPL